MSNNEHELTGAFSVAVDTGRFADRIATMVADRVMEWLTQAQPMQSPPAAGAVLDEYRRDPDPLSDPLSEIPRQPGPDGYPLGRHAPAQPEPDACSPACDEGHTYAGMCAASQPNDPCPECGGDHDRYSPTEDPCPPAATGPADPRWHDRRFVPVEQDDRTVIFMPVGDEHPTGDVPRVQDSRCSVCGGHHDHGATACPEWATGVHDPRWLDPRYTAVERPDGIVVFETDADSTP